MTRKRRRLWIVLACGLGLGSATALTLAAFSDNLVFFVAPSDIGAKHFAAGRTLRLGGLVEPGSVQRTVIDGRPTAQFRVTDGKRDIAVSYVGILPDLFREGQGIVATGALDEGRTFEATEVLAKHDENYMPPQVAEKLQTPQGHSCTPFKSVLQPG